MIFDIICNLVFPGPLPSPEHVHVRQLINSSTIEWNPPYSELNNESDVIHVDPGITKYTVYVVNYYTRDSIEIRDVSETQYIFRSNAPDNDFCPVYSVTAWNSGGEGRSSMPVPGYALKSKHTVYYLG